MILGMKTYLNVIDPNVHKEWMDGVLSEKSDAVVEISSTTCVLLFEKGSI